MGFMGVDEWPTWKRALLRRHDHRLGYGHDRLGGRVGRPLQWTGLVVLDLEGVIKGGREREW